MTMKIGTTVVVEPEVPASCEVCGVVAELRPYGVGGKKICVECAMRDPETMRTCWAAMRARLESLLVGTTLVVGPRGEVFRVGHASEDLAGCGLGKDRRQ